MTACWFCEHAVRPDQTCPIELGEPPRTVDIPSCSECTSEYDAIAGVILLPIALLTWLAEHRAWRKHYPKQNLPERAAEHPQVAGLLEQGRHRRTPCR
ncbi:hypothetical protein GCM10010191_92310 [Actinomadura vinacea]|uniref:Uncharacterized protein n=1 Tax=Actinomadura vinacea TaxID=115336 RepID=A0ABN3KIN9_9ACTN